MLYAQVSHALGWNDVCDALRLQVSALWAVRGATPPARNTQRHAIKIARNSREARRLSAAGRAFELRTGQTWPISY